MDPFALLGVSPDVTPEELTAVYRRLAKEWHPDRQATPEAVWRMAQINAAYDAVRAAIAQRSTAPAPRSEQPEPERAPAGAWLDASVRAALGPELTRALHDGEPVSHVVPVATWASPQSRLAVTDRRLLWLLEDLISDRVRSLRFDAIAEVDVRLAWPRRRTAALRLRDEYGRRTSFAELAPAIAHDLAGHVRGRLAA